MKYKSLYVETVHLAAEFEQSHGALQIHLDGRFEHFVEADRGGSVENDRHVLAQHLLVHGRYAQAGQRHVSSHRNQFVQRIGRIFLQQVENLNISTKK